MTDEEFKHLFETLREENAAGHAETRRVLREEDAETRRLLREENAVAHAETRRLLQAEDAETRRLLREENAVAHAETRRLLRDEDAETRRLLREENAVAHAETRRLLRDEDAETRRLLREENAAAHVETRLHFEVVVERLERKFDLLGDGLVNLNEKLDRETADIRKEMRQGFADTHALIRFSHTERANRRKR